MDAHVGQEGLTGKAHFVARIALSDPAVKSLLSHLQSVVGAAASLRGDKGDELTR